MDTRSYSKEFITDFINLYRSHPCLWKVKSKEYSDRNKKSLAYDTLIEKLKEVERNADREMVTKKVNNLRSSFRKELKKYLASLKSGSGTEEIYTPHLWYYDQLTFLTDSETPKRSVSNIEFDEQEDTNVLEQIESLSPSTSNVSSQSEASLPFARPTSTVRQRPKRKKEQDAADCLLQTVNEKLKNIQEEDEFDSIGKYVAIKLRNLARDQKIFAEKLINDTLFEGQLGTLNRSCYVAVVKENVTPLQILNSSSTSRVQVVNENGTPLQNYILDFNAESM